MNSVSSILVVVLVAFVWQSNGLATENNRVVNRRESLFGVAALTTPLLVVSPSLAKAEASVTGASKFVGTYSDPINHPGGKRRIELTGETVGDYQLAKVMGGGGVGEPKNYVLPAAVLGDRTIVIDFSPKGGPRDFVGILDKNGDIKFTRDGNRWPRLNE